MRNKTNNSERELLEAKKKLLAMKYVLIIVFLAWPLGLFHSWALSFLIFILLFALWGVSTYIAFMHYLTIKKRME